MDTGMSGRGSHDELIAQFRDVTGLPLERAQFYLEASGWELQVALGSFFEDEQGEEMEHQEGPQGQGTGAEVKSETAAAPGAIPATGAPTASSGFMQTLSSLLSGAGGGAEGSEDSDDEPQAFYAGGSTTSGQQVLGPPRKKDRDDFIKDLFEKAREHGATAEDAGAATSTSGGPQAAHLRFAGTGYKLGDAASGSESQALPAAPGDSRPRGPREVILRLWRNGFTLDDGELRPYTEPANIMFLDSIKRGEIPRELIRAHPGHEVELAMEDKRAEEWKPPKPTVKPFGGKGQTLGNPTPSVTSAAAAAAAGQSKDKEANELAAKSLLNLSDSQPQTNIQIRLADGTRLVGRFNHSHTVGDVYTYINTARPEWSQSSYSLVTFPNIEVSKREETLKDANLLNASLTQKIQK